MNYLVVDLDENVYAAGKTEEEAMQQFNDYLNGVDYGEEEKETAQTAIDSGRFQIIEGEEPENY